MRTGLYRRKLLAGVASALALASVPLLPNAKEHLLGRLRVALFGVCGGGNTLARLSYACSRIDPIEVQVSPDDLARSFDRAAVSGFRFGRWFEREIRDDFDAGRVVSVEGWIIAQTEYQLFLTFVT